MYNEENSVFLASLEKLKKYCDDSVFQMDRKAEERDAEVTELLQENHFDSTPEINALILELISTHYKTKIFRNISQYIKSLMQNPSESSPLPQERPQVFETISWLLRKLENKYLLMDFRHMITSAYGSSTLASIEQFQNIQIESLKAEFFLDKSEQHIQDYITQIYSLFTPQNLHKFKLTEPDFENQHTFPTEKQHPCFPRMFGVRLNSKDFGGDIYRNIGDNQDVPLEEEEGFEPKNPSPHMNRSKKFNFRRGFSNLRVSLVKGLQMENVELYDQLSKMLHANHEVYTDEMFPPIASSLTTNLKEFPIAQKATWKRVSDLYNPKNIALCGQQVGPNDMQQGKLGNCYFLSALSVLSENTDFIKRLFHAKEVNSVGCYSLWLCDSGEWKSIIVDDYIPCLMTSYGQFVPCFSKSKGQDIWVLLLEKSFAKLFGSYHAIEGGLQSEAFGTLTGAPTKEFSPKENGVEVKLQMWEFITNSLKNKFIVTAASKSPSQILNKQSMGIVSDHAYAVLDAQEVSQANGTKEKIVKIRNPWGRYEWKGAWGDNSPHWTSQIKKQVNYEVQDEDGIFWMNLADFYANFDQICRCEVHNDYYFSFLKFGENGIQNQFLARLTLYNDDFIYINLQQKMKKHFRKNPDYDYSFVRLLLIKLDQNGKVESLIHGKYKQNQCIVLRRELKKGQYLVFIEIDWIQKIYNQVNLTIYSNKKIDLQEEKISKHYAAMLYQSFSKSYALANPSFVARQYDHDGTKIEALKYKVEKFGLVIMVYINNDPDYILNVRVNLRQLTNMELFLPEKNDSQNIEFKLSKDQTEIIVLKAKVFETEETAFSYLFGEAFKLSQSFSPSQLKLLCQSKGKKIQSLNDGNVEVYNYKYLGGFADFYLNKGSKGVFEEEIAFDLKNFLVNGAAQTDNLKITLHPGEEFLLDMKIQNIFNACSCSRKSKTKFTK